MSLPTRTPDNASRFFSGSYFSLISTSLVLAVKGALKGDFLLSNAVVGFIGGAATIWGFTRMQTQIPGPADNYGGLMSFQFVAPLAMILIVLFWFLHFAGKRKTIPMLRAQTPSSEPAGASS